MTLVDIVDSITNKKTETCKIADLARMIRELKIQLDKADEHKKSLQKLYDELTINIVPERMDEEEIKTMNIPGVGRLQASSDIYCSCPKDNKEKLQEWLIDNGHGSMVAPTVNSSTLKAFVKEQMKADDGVYPDELLKITPYSRATVVKG